jgi:hypothetical protein
MMATGSTTAMGIEPATTPKNASCIGRDARKFKLRTGAVSKYLALDSESRGVEARTVSKKVVFLE